MTNPANLKKSILDYAIRGELSAKFRLSCHCEERSDEAIQKNSKISKFKDNGNSLDCFDFSAKNLAMTNKTALDEIAEFNAKISTLKSQREKLLSNLEKLLKTKPKNSDKIKHIIAKIKTKIKSYRTITPLNTDLNFNPPFEIPNSWVWVKLGDLGIWKSGSTPLRNNSQFFINGTINWLKTGDLNDSFIYHTEEKITQNALKSANLHINKIGSILIAMYGATIGKLGIAKIPLATNQACCACSCNSLLFNYYLFYFLLQKRDYFLSLGSGSGQPNISREKIIETIIPLPPKNEQIYISQVLQNLLKECENYEAKALNLANLQTKFKTQIPKSILDYAVRGELSAKFRLSCHCEERTGRAISSLSSLRESEATKQSRKIPKSLNLKIMAILWIASIFLRKISQ
ncbi:restriction endonuclease subunit S [Campylobacter sp. JMF_06 NA1]|uniref:restriction endonuclease subunit S n=1 Tax=Campylobacter sp. JMF_06 NA1 TaxID=2983823 RepID=UPI0022E99ED1|nr:restriction endonuclease subunit S [Campylobacter sp. JMF_06 NA1]MDA3077575.1 restriction endonuclease subunit S [Campylobacter sp. JMF_06 NA1]